MEGVDEIVLLARVQPRETLEALARRVGEDPSSAKKAIRAANGGLPHVKSGHWVRVPYRVLSAAYRKTAIEALFPADHATPAGWEHRVAALSGKPESLWRIAEWFAGDGVRYKEIREADAITSLETREGQVVLVPERLLRRRSGRPLPPRPPPPSLRWPTRRRRSSSSARTRRGATRSTG